MHNSLAEEYGFTPQQKQRTNGHDPIERAPDPKTEEILKSRDTALGDRRLKGQHKAFICFAFERCLQQTFWRDYERGVCCMADSIVADKFGVSERTVYNWRHHEATADYLWFTKQRRPDKWAMMVYHLLCLHPRPATRLEWTDPGGGSYAARARARQSAPPEDLAAQGRDKRNARLKEKREQKSLPLQGGIAVVPEGVTGKIQAPKLPKSSVFRQISAECRKRLRLTAETHFGSQPKQTSADSRNALRLTAETDFGSEPKPASADSRNRQRPTAETDCRDIKAKKQVQGKSVGKLEGGGEGSPPSPPPPQEIFSELLEKHPSLWPWLNTLPGTFPSHLREQRKKVAALLSKATNNQKPFLRAKLTALDYYIDGPAPPDPTPEDAKITLASLPRLLTKEEAARNVAALKKLRAEAGV